MKKHIRINIDLTKGQARAMLIWLDDFDQIQDYNMKDYEHILGNKKQIEKLHNNINNAKIILRKAITEKGNDAS